MAKKKTSTATATSNGNRWHYMVKSVQKALQLFDENPVIQSDYAKEVLAEENGGQALQNAIWNEKHKEEIAAHPEMARKTRLKVERIN